MHLQINLSNQLIKQWKPVLTAETPETHPLLQWRIDKIKLANTTANYICVNEPTLFSFILPHLPGKKALEIQQLFVIRLRSFLCILFFPQPAHALFDRLAVLYGKSNNPSLTGTITSMRHTYECHYRMERPLDEAEQLVNQIPFQGPNYRFPLDEFLRLRDLFEDPDVRMISFQMPKDLVYAARRAFHWNDPPALRCFDMASETDGLVTARLSIDDLIVLNELILQKLEQPEFFEVKKALFPVSVWLKAALAKVL